MKKISYLIVLFLSIFVFSNVYALKCTYTDFSSEYGLTKVEVEIDESKPEKSKAIITSWNGQGDSDHEGLKIKKDNFEKYNKVCPYYLVAEKSFVAITINATSVNGYYTYNEAKGKWNSVIYKEKDHLLVSSTIKEDKEKNGEKYNDSTDNPNNVSNTVRNGEMSSQHDQSKDIALTCSYNSPQDSGNKYTAGNLYLYKDGTSEVVVTMFEGADQGWAEHNHFTPEFFDNAESTLVNEKKCPYYLGVSYALKNHVGLGNNKDAVYAKYPAGKNKTHVLVSKTIADDKEDYDEKENGVVTYLTYAQEQYEKKNEERLFEDVESRASKNIGDDFCNEVEVKRALNFIGIILMIVKFVIPIIIIVMGIMDFASAVVAGNPSPEILKKKAISLGLRIVIGIFIMVFPTILHAFLNGLSQYNSMAEDIQKCQSCLLEPNKTNCG